jgi:sterol desaturase/sphingolipid hydroxylase (fatty acid hydroxylase superfamily)
MKSMLIVLAIPVFFVLIALEWYYGRRTGKASYRFNDTIANLNIGIGNQVFGLLYKGLLLGMFFWVSKNWGLFQIPSNVFTWILCLVLWDFLYYWAHRWGHEVNFFWAAHVVHHSSEDYNLGVALRQSWFHNLLAGVIFLPVPLLGFDTLTIISVAGVVTLYQFWIHTEAIERMPRWFEYVFNAPAHHRVHHARDPKYIDKNYAAVFIVWDRLFGTYMDEDERPHYGITSNINSWDPTWANFHYYAEMWHNARRMTSWADRLKLIFARPGWLPEYLGGYQAPPPVPAVLHKYNADSRPTHWYIAFQFTIVSVGLVLYMVHFDSLSLAFQWGFAAYIIATTAICSALFEHKTWVRWAQYPVLLAGFGLLNLLFYSTYPEWFSLVLALSGALLLVQLLWFKLLMRTSN